MQNKFEEAYQSLELDVDTTENFIEKYYVNRNSMRNEDLFTHLELAPRISTKKFIFGGPRGSGKTTELYKILYELRKKDFFVVMLRIDKDNVFSNNEFHYGELLYAIIKKITDAAKRDKIKIKNNNKLKNELDSLLHEFSGKTKTSEIKTTESSFGLFAEVLSRLKIEFLKNNHKKTEFIKKTNELVSDIITLTNQLIESIANEKKEIVIMIDDLEKIHNMNPLKDFLINRGQELAALKCKIVITLPQEIYHVITSARLPQNFHQPISLSLPEIKNREGVKNTEKIEKFIEVVRKRKISDKIISDEIIKQCAIKSGGYILDFRNMLQTCCAKATSQKKDEITSEILNETINDFTLQYMNGLKKKDFKRLKEIHEKKALIDELEDSEYQETLRVLEYVDTKGDKWFDVHPLIIDEIYKK